MKIALLTTAILVFAAAPASAVLVLTNGSFELPATPGSATQIVVGTTEGDWTADALGQDAFIAPPPPSFTASAPAPVDGDQYIQLNANSLATGQGGRIFQLLGTTSAGLPSDITLAANFYERDSHPGATYSFGLYSDAAGSVPLGELTGQALVPGSWDASSVTATGVAAGTSVYAFFTADDATATQFFWIDDVTLTVTQIPEPSSLLLVGLGVLGLGAVRRRRQR